MKNRKNFLIICIILIIAIIIYLAFSIYKDINHKEKVDKMVTEINELSDEYEDAKLWVKIDGTSIDMPVFQAKDNDRYLRNDRDNIETNWGEVFLDFRNDLNHMYEKTNIIIYGHNTEENSYFSSLLKYEEKNFFENNKIIKLATKDRIYEFEVFSVLKTDDSYFYIDTEFSSVEEYDLFTKDLKEKSIYDTGVELSSNDTILTLSTCDYTKENGRFVVIGKLKK